MRGCLCLWSFCFFLAASTPAEAATGRVVKVLPHFLDLEGRHSLSPSLYDRDAYQSFLRQHPEKRSGVRFDVQWKARGRSATPLKLRLELRGTALGDLPPTTTLEKEVQAGGWFSHWISFPLTGEEYKAFGDAAAWRVTLWEGDQRLGEQQSFLW